MPCVVCPPVDVVAMDHRHIATAQDLDVALLRFFQSYRRSPLRRQVDDGEALLDAAAHLSLGDGDYGQQRSEALDCVREIVAQARRSPRARELEIAD